MPIDYRPPEPIPLRPAAQPVDTFTGTARPVNNTALTDLAQGLSVLDGGLRNFMAARRETEAEEDAIKGQAAFYENNQAGFEDAVREGKIPAFASPTFVASYKKAQGSVAGFDLQAKFSAAYDAWDGKASEDPQAFTKFSQQFLAESLGKNQDPNVLKGILPHVNSLMANGMQTWIADRHKATVEGSLITSSAEVSQKIEGGMAVGRQTGKGTNYPAVFADILATREAAIKSGHKPIQYDKVLIDAVIAKAHETRDPKLLMGFFDLKVPGMGDATFGSTPYGAKEKQQAIDKMEVLGRRAEADAEKQQKDRDKKAEDLVTATVIEGVAKDPSKPIPEDFLKLGQRYNPKFRVEMLAAQKALSEGTRTSEPQALLRLHADIFAGRPGAIQEALLGGTIKNAADLDKAISLEKSVAGGGDVLKEMRAHEISKQIRQAIVARTANKENMALITAGVVGMPEDGLRATSAFERLVVDFAAANPKATAAQQLEAIDKAGKMVLDSLSTKQMFGDAKFTPKEGVPATGWDPAPGQPTAGPGVTQPAVPTVPSPTPPPAPPGQRSALPPLAPSASPAASPATLEEAHNWAAKALTPTQRIILERDAQDKGQSFDAKVLETYGKFKALSEKGGSTAGEQAPLGAGGDDIPDTTRHLAERNVLDALRRFKGSAARVKATTGAPFTVAALRDDPIAANILDFVSGPESNGNYNAIIGNARATRDLSKLSISEVYQLQRDAVNRGMPSGAIGRYQFINRTLRGLVEKLNISRDAKFTPELQDRLAIELLHGRGYAAWKAGRMTDEQFAANLSKEWASLPDPNKGGRSHYDGDRAGNRAGTSLASVYDMLRRAVTFEAQAATPRPPSASVPITNPAPPPAQPAVQRPAPPIWWTRLWAALFGNR